MTSANERVPSERAREVGQRLLQMAGDCWDRDWEADILKQELFIAALTRYAAEARLEEAKWWDDNCGFPGRGGLLRQQRIAALEQQLAKVKEP
jgi:hypothetical protein